MLSLDRQATKRDTTPGPSKGKAVPDPFRKDVP